MADCPSCAGDRYLNFRCEHCGYNPETGRPWPTANLPPGKIILTHEQNEDYLSMVRRIATALEKIERHMAYNNGTLEGLTRNFDPNIGRK